MGIKYSLRCHHLVCLNLYKGIGYSKEFISNMDMVKKTITDDTLIDIKTDNDLICNTCPNLKNNKCITLDKVKRYDNYVLNILNKHFNSLTNLKYKDIKDIIIKEILLKDGLSLMCSDCEFNKLCKQILKEEIC